jgi:hypothetical protein
MRKPAGPIAVVLSVAMLLHGAPALAQAPPAQAPPQAPPASTTTPPASKTPQTPPSTDRLDRIREGVKHESALKLEDGKQMLYVEIIGKFPTWVDMTKGYDLLHGPAGGGNPMSHQEFLGMVTPREMHSSGGITAPEILTMALVNYFGQKAIVKGLQALDKSRDRKKIAEISARIDAELAALAALRGGK